MRSTITRTIIETKIHSAKIDFVDGNPVATPLEPIIVHGNVSEESAKKIAVKKHGKEGTIVVSKIETAEKFYEISVEDFVKHAKVVDKNPEESETKN